MRTSTSDRLTRATTEQLLDGGSGPAGLHRLLAAAANPGTASELAGETAAVAAFIEAPPASPRPGASSMLGTALSKILAAKAVAAVVVLAGATGGVALAATVSGTPWTPPADGPAATPMSTATPSSSEEPEPGTGRVGAGDPDPAASRSPDARVDDDQPGRTGTASGHDGEDPDGPPADAPGAASVRGVPPTAAPGNPDRPAGPPADRAGQDGEKQNDEKQNDEKQDDDKQNSDKQNSNQQNSNQQNDDKQNDDKQDKGNDPKADDKGRSGDSPAADRRPTS